MEQILLEISDGVTEDLDAVRVEIFSQTRPVGVLGPTDEPLGMRHEPQDAARAVG